MKGTSPPSYPTKTQTSSHESSMRAANQRLFPFTRKTYALYFIFIRVCPFLLTLTLRLCLFIQLSTPLPVLLSLPLLLVWRVPSAPVLYLNSSLYQQTDRSSSWLLQQEFLIFRPVSVIFWHRVTRDGLKKLAC